MNELQKLIIKYPNLTMKFIEEHPDETWNWGWISSNPNITINHFFSLREIKSWKRL